MPDLVQLAFYSDAALVLAVTPGPAFYAAARRPAGGRAEGVASSLGTGLGGMVWASSDARVVVDVEAS